MSAERAIPPKAASLNLVPSEPPGGLRAGRTPSKAKKIATLTPAVVVVLALVVFARPLG